MPVHQKRSGILGFVLVAAMTTWILTSTAVGQATFQGLGDLGGHGGSGAKGISADGSVVVGNSDSRAFRWTRDGGMVGLGLLPGAVFGSIANGVSADGSVVVGSSDSIAFLWTDKGGMVGLGAQAGGVSSRWAKDVSADGSVVVGYGRPSAFRWTSKGGLVSLIDQTGGFVSLRAESVSADGGVVVGGGSSGLGHEAFRWTSEVGFVGLGDLEGGGFSGKAWAVSADGLVVVGESRSTASVADPCNDCTEAFRWTSEGGMVGLGDLPGRLFYSVAKDASGDGSVVVGYSNSIRARGNEAFIWDATNGMQSLEQVLEMEYGLGLFGWQLAQALAISDDGLTIAGTGVNPDGNVEAWIVTLPAPCPADLNGDGIVNVLDLLQVVHALRTEGDVPEDLDGDGVVTTNDMILVIRSFGPCDNANPAGNKPVRIRDRGRLGGGVGAPSRR